MKKLTLNSMAAIAALMLAATVSAQNATFNASRTFEFDPDHTNGAVAKWSNTIGLQDLQGSGNTKFGLRLEKNVPIDAVVAAGAVLNGLKGVVVNAGDTMGYDMKNNSTATTVGSGPRFNVSWTLGGVSNFSFVGGSNNATRTPACQDPANWTTYRMNLQTQAFPSIPAGAVLQSVVLILDEPGQNTLDNINFRNQIAAKSGNSANSTGCP